MSRKFWLFIVALMVLLLALEYQMPRRFVWNPTFAHDDRQPFGCYVFDSVLATTMPHGYTVCRKSLSQLALEKASPRSIIIIQTGYQGERVNNDTLIALASRGNRILYADSYFSSELCDTLHIHCSSENYFSESNFRKSMERDTPYDTIHWTGDSTVYQPSITSVHPQFINACILDTIPAVPLAKIHYRDVVALSYPIGKGELILVTTPLMFTNYGMLNYTEYVHRLMNRLKPLPVVRTEAYMPNYNVAESSPFRELLKRPPLRWALYLVLLGVVLMMGFNARRRQRAIPVETPPRNYQLDFIRHIGTLQYMKQKQNKIWKKEKKEEA